MGVGEVVHTEMVLAKDVFPIGQCQEKGAAWDRTTGLMMASQVICMGVCIAQQRYPVH
jgi:hypothetical protein